MSKQDKEQWQQRQSASDAGYDPKPWEGVKIHSHNHISHELSKAALCYVLDERGYGWDTETTMDDGRVDVFSFQGEDERPVIYEIETGLTDAQKRNKVNQYKKGPVRDVLCFDPENIPTDFEDAVEYFREQVL